MRKIQCLQKQEHDKCNGVTIERDTHKVNGVTIERDACTQGFFGMNTDFTM